MKFTIVEPFYSGSHMQWLDGLVSHSEHQWNKLTLRGKYWKWRMQGGAIPLAEMAAEQDPPDAFLVSDMLDVALFRSLLPQEHASKPFVLYFHENQLMYPDSGKEFNRFQQDLNYAFINYTSALNADQIVFNSKYHRKGFYQALETFLKALPDHRGLENIQKFKDRSTVIPVGLEELSTNTDESRWTGKHTILWNHRHEFDKGPDEFFKVLISLSEKGYDFDLVVLGESYAREPEIFGRARSLLSKHILHWGEASRTDYVSWLNRATLLPVTSKHDFFGISVLEAAGNGVLPLLPRRLAYPEHFGAFDHVFYDDGMLEETLIYALSKPYVPAKEIINCARELTWEKVIGKYDLLMKEVKLKP